MKLFVSSYFHTLLTVGAIYLCINDFDVGLAYIVASLPLFFFTSKFAKIPEKFFSLFLIVCGGIWGSYLLRPLFLIPNSNFFKYQNVGTINIGDHINALLQIALFSTFFLTSLYVAIFFFHRKHRSDRQHTITEKKNKSNFLLRTKQPLILFMLSLLLFNLFLKFTLGTRFSAENSLSMVVGLLLPIELIIPLAVFYLLSYKYRLNYNERLFFYVILALHIISRFYDGSKAALIEVIMYVIVLLLCLKGDFKISIKKALILVSGGIIVLLISFPLATSIKYVSLNRVTVEWAVNYFFQALDFRLSDSFLFLIDKITGRFCGYDGLLIVNLEIPAPILKIFSEGYIFNHSIAKLVPGWSVPGIGLGKAVGTYYTGHALEVKHAGALGLFGSLSLVGGSIGSYIYVSMLGLIWGMFFRVINGLSINQQNKKLLSSIFCVQLLFWFMSGNLDSSISCLIIYIVHILFYSLLFVLLSQSIRPRSSFLHTTSTATQSG